MTAPENDSTNILPPGTLVGGTYEVKRLLAQHPVSAVYAAWHVRMSRDVALKVLTLSHGSEDRKRLLRFQSEAKSVANLDHPNIVKTLASGVLENGSPYIVMELIEGSTLKDFLQDKGVLTPATFKEIFLQLLAGLSCAHAARILHRDIKPENILISQAAGESLAAKLSDFGIAKLLDDDSAGQSLTSTSEVLGSPAYMSPEQCARKAVDERSDIYSLACVMYEALCQKPPFAAESALDLMYKQINEKAVPLSRLRADVPPGFRLLVERGMDKQPEKRWSSANELRAALEALSTSPGLRMPLPVAYGLLITFLVCLAGFAACFLLNRQAKSDHKPARSVQIKKLGKASLTSFEDVHHAINTRRFNEASQMLKQLESAPGFADHSHLKSCYALLCYSRSDFSGSLDYARQAWRICRKNEPAGDRNEYWSDYDDPRLTEAHCLIRMKDFPGAKTILDEQEKHRRSSLPSRPLHDLAASRCEYYRVTGDLDNDIKLCHKMLAERGMETSLQMCFLIELMKASALKNDRQELQKATSSVRRILSELSPELRLVFSAQAAGAYLLNGDWKMPQVILERAGVSESKYRQMETTEVAYVLQIDAAVNLAAGLLSPAMPAARRAVEIQEKLKDKQIIPAYLDLAFIAWKTNDEATARSYMEKALACSEDEWSCCLPETQSADAELFLAERLSGEGNIKAARRCLKQALSLPQLSQKERARAADLSRSLR